MIYTRKLKAYLGKLTLRVLVLFIAVGQYLTRKDGMIEFLTREIFFRFSLLHVLWGAFMFIMILHLFPSRWRSMALLKAKEDHYVPVEHEEYELLRFEIGRAHV